jgi:hypothetical protein
MVDVVLARWQGALAAVVVTLTAVALVGLDLTDAGFRSWWAARALTTDIVAGVLVLLVTVLVVDQVVSRRQFKERSRAVAAQAAIVVSQAVRAQRAVTATINGPGEGNGTGEDGTDRAAADASEEVRTYLVMLLVAAPLFIDAKPSRAFLEACQRLAGEMARALAALARGDGPPPSLSRMQDAVGNLRAAATPVLAPLDLRELIGAADDVGA